MEFFSEIVSNRWVYLAYCFIFFLITIGINKEVLYFFFFADKPKSFKREYKKKHNFFYRFFCCFVFNGEYMKKSKFYKYIVRYFIAYLIPVIFFAVLLIFSCFIDSTDQRQTDLFGLLMILMVTFAAANDIWYLLHSKKEPGFRWYLPQTWHRCEFYIDLPGCDKNGHLKKTGKSDKPSKHNNSN